MTKEPIEEDRPSTPRAQKFGQTTKAGNFDKEGENLDMPASLSEMKKRKGSDEAADDGKKKVEDVEKARAKLGRPATSSGRKKREVNDEALGRSSYNLTGKLRRGYGTELSESQVAAEKKVYGLELDENVVKRGSSKSTMSSGKEETSAADCSESEREEKKDSIMSAEKKIVGNLRIARDEGKSQEQIEQASSPGEIKKSKYSSPSCTDLKVQGRKELEAEPHKVSDESQLCKMMTTAVGPLYESPPILMGSRVS